MSNIDSLSDILSNRTKSITEDRINSIDLEETSPVYLDLWNRFDVNEPLLVGMRFGVRSNRENAMTFGTIGPSVKSIYPSSIIPDNWFFTCAQMFINDNGEYHIDSYLYDSSGNNIIGRLIGLYKAINWAIIEINHLCSSNVKISVEGDQLPISGSIDFDSFNIYSDWPEVVKSGSSSGITKGKIFSWGHHINTKQFPVHARDNIARPNEILIQRDNSSGDFAIGGDSGAPLLVMNDNQAICAGLVTGKLIHENLKLTVISPIHKNINHILNFVRSVLLAQGIIANYDDSLF